MPTSVCRRNRAILDSTPGEFRRQITYKTSWLGSRLAVLDRMWPLSKTCSACGWRNPGRTLADRVFTCTTCGLTLDRDRNAVCNIARHAQPVALGEERPPPTAMGQHSKRRWRERKSRRPPGRKADPSETGGPVPGRATPEEQCSGHPHIARHHRPMAVSP
ncbi:zinc ribbon domain-containing protein [Streptomyces rimosus]|uniref:zinc ribbon domain-containing protein n=1 Tax=Streptomyces rimosus TaxID=1927 RepID=UPI003789C178